METPKEKAINLVEKYQEKPIIEYTHYAGGQSEYTCLNEREAIECAKIAVEEIIKLLPNINNIPPKYRESEDRYFQYWYGVKNELNKL